MTTAFPHRGPGAPLEVDGTEVECGGNGGPLVIFNLTGQPALVAPAGLDHDGLTIGMQIVGPRWSEMQLIAIAHALEKGRHPARVLAPSRLLTRD